MKWRTTVGAQELSEEDDSPDSMSLPVQPAVHLVYLLLYQQVCVSPVKQTGVYDGEGRRRTNVLHCQRQVATWHPAVKSYNCSLIHKGVFMRGLILCSMVLLFAFGNSFGKIHSWKGAVHLSMAPFLEATGIYSDVRMLQTAEQTGTQAGAITNLSLLAVQAGLGATILFTDDDLPPVVRVIHRIVGASVIASALWISIEGSLDKGVPSTACYTAYAHTALATAPLILMTF